MIDFENKSVFKLDPEPLENGLEKVKDLLIDGENVIDSYRTMRDRVVFTNKRIIAINVQGVGAKKDYTSLPYRKIQYFSVETAGLVDMDAELTIVMAGCHNNIRFELGRGAKVRDLCRAISEYIL